MPEFIEIFNSYHTCIRYLELNSTLGEFKPKLNTGKMKGALVETTILGELLKNMDICGRIYYCRTRNQTEIDFILKK
jgi:predicted AAA+ superfamily ATPase